MRLSLKILGLSAVLLTTLLVIAVALPFLVDVNPYKGQIVQAIKKHSNLDIEINGDLQLSLFPWAGIVLHDIALHDPSAFGNTPLVYAQKIEVKAKLLPLLQKRLEMKTVTLNGVAIKLVTLANGKSNWAQLTDTATPAAENTNEASSALPLTALALEGLHINDASLLWRDATAPTDMQITALTLQTGAMAFGQAVIFTGSAEIHDKIANIRSTIALDGRLTLAQNLENIRLDALNVAVTLRTDTLLAPLSATLNLSAEVDLKTQRLSSQSTLIIEDLTLKTSLLGHDILAAPQFTGTLKIDRFSPRPLIEKYMGTLDMADANALETATFSSQFSVDEKQFKLNDLRLAFDQTVFTGQSTVDLSALSYDLVIKGTALDLDRYLPPVVEASASSDALNNAEEDILFPEDTLRTLRELTLRAKLTMQSVKTSGIELSQMTLHSTAKNGLINLDPLTVTLSGGTLHSRVSINLQKAMPTFQLIQNAQNIAAGPLLQALADTSLLTGQASFKANLQAQGNSEKDLMQSLAGTGDFSFSEGAIIGINFADTIRRAKAKLKGRPLPDNTAPKKTNFTELTGNVRIKNRQINNPSLTMKAPYLRITGSGDINLNTESVDYLANITFTGTEKGQSGKDLQELVGVTIPLRIGGTFDKLTYKPNLKKVAKNEAKKKVEQRLDKLLKKKLGIDLKGLKQLF